MASATQQQKDGSGDLFNNLIAANNLKSDAGLARALEVAPPVISKIRHHRRPIGATLTIRIMEKFGVSLTYVRQHLAGEGA